MARSSTTFKKGNPGGPGRPPGSKNGSTVAREWMEREGWDLIIKMASGKVKGIPPTTCADLCKYLADRAYGKPTQETAAKVGGRLTLEDLVEESNKQPERE